jgi:hypothetical protein
MDFFQGVVADYLRSSRTRFVNAECLIQLAPGNTLLKNAHWYCDFITVDFSERTAYLCEVTFARAPHSLFKRLEGWVSQWNQVRQAIARDCAVPAEWEAKTWLFLPEANESAVRARVEQMLTRNSGDSAFPFPRITTLESILPWKYRSWNGIPYAEHGR